MASLDPTRAESATTLAESPESLQPDQTVFAIEEFLASEETKDLLRFSTAGSVDDGKSTLIGRLLYDSRNVYEDQVRAVTGTIAAPDQKQLAIDFAQLTDGLRAEREQGITIDVAYRYFSTQRRKFIIADTPGHEQYTRNMATGASTADLAIILNDARKGILTQSRRHAYIASLLGIRHLVVAVNKMDLVDFSEVVYRRIEIDFAALVKQFGNASLVTIPVSALDGDNVVEPSLRTSWYTGLTLLEHLEQVSVGTLDANKAFRLPIQRVIRPDHNYRGFAGQIASGTIRKGGTIRAARLSLFPRAAPAESPPLPPSMAIWMRPARRNPSPSPWRKSWISVAVTLSPTPRVLQSPPPSSKQLLYGSTNLDWKAISLTYSSTARRHSTLASPVSFTAPTSRLLSMRRSTPSG